MQLLAQPENGSNNLPIVTHILNTRISVDRYISNIGLLFVLFHTVLVF